MVSVQLNSSNGSARTHHRHFEPCLPSIDDSPILLRAVLCRGWLYIWNPSQGCKPNPSQLNPADPVLLRIVMIGGLMLLLCPQTSAASMLCPFALRLVGRQSHLLLPVDGGLEGYWRWGRPFRWGRGLEGYWFRRQRSILAKTFWPWILCAHNSGIDWLQMFRCKISLL